MTDNPNYTPVDWNNGAKLDVEGIENAMSAIKDSGYSAADVVSPLTTAEISGYEPPESLDYYDVPEPKIPSLEELEGAAVVVDGKVVGRVGKSNKFPDISGPFKIMPGNANQPSEIVATLNGLGETVKVGDTVSHIATKDDRGTVEEIGSALIANTDVPNAVKVRWPSPAGIEDNDTVSWHHVDNLVVH